MSSLSSEGSSKMASIRAEIERRVMEQLSKKRDSYQINRSSSDSFEETVNIGKRNSVSSISQRSFQDEDVTDDMLLSGKRPIEKVVEGPEPSELQALNAMHNKQGMENEKRKRETESTENISLEVHGQMVKDLEKKLLELKGELLNVIDDLEKSKLTLLELKKQQMNEQSGLSDKVLEIEEVLFSLKDQLSQVKYDVEEREDTLLSLKQLTVEQRESSKKINNLSGELMKRLTEEQLNNSLQEMKQSLKYTQDGFVSLGFDFDKTKTDLATVHKEQKRVHEEIHARIMALEIRICENEDTLKGFNLQSVISELQTVKIELDTLQDSQMHEQTLLSDLQAKMNHIVFSLKSNDQQIKDILSEVGYRVKEQEMKDAFKKFMDEIGKQILGVQGEMQCIRSEQAKTMALLGSLQEEWKSDRTGLEAQVADLEANLANLKLEQNHCVLEELSSIKRKVNELQNEQNYEKSFITNLQNRFTTLENQVSSLSKKISEDIEAQKQNLLQEVHPSVEKLQRDLCTQQADWIEEQKAHNMEFQTQIRNVKDKLSCLEAIQSQGLSEVSSVNEKLVDLQQERNLWKASDADARKQMVELENKLIGIFKEMDENVKSQKQSLLEEVRFLVDEIIRHSSFGQNYVEKEWEAEHRELMIQLKGLEDKIASLEILQNQTASTKIPNIEATLGNLQEEQRQERSLISEAQSQLVLLENRMLDPQRQTSDDTELLKEQILEEVRILVNELLRNPSLHESKDIIQSASVQKYIAITENFDYNEPKSSRQESSRIIEKTDAPEILQPVETQRALDKGTASLEAFFTVMGHLIREELKRMDHASVECLPYTKLQESAVFEDSPPGHIEQPFFCAKLVHFQVMA
ncbi:hypothetical protein KP509_37G052800 [Ceratopteris richardii]|nr:hypothetical protein KP509_37G052800 [Ceratopteris richardii]KAH7280117.1 hypothetical protein KP509_37G052800 [Ceratopteris richardii]KAH7280119.1 hypothetical protein KP509_37G052800 [Ceratopteris richardii]KAH7280120.1 hypothetical protein KP509_37G052800 [Ceratopteris richardii]